MYPFEAPQTKLKRIAHPRVYLSKLLTTSFPSITQTLPLNKEYMFYYKAVISQLKLKNQQQATVFSQKYNLHYHNLTAKLQVLPCILMPLCLEPLSPIFFFRFFPLMILLMISSFPIHSGNPQPQLKLNC